MTLTGQDRVEIMDLCARYNISTDNADVDGFMDCWVEEGNENYVRFESPFGNFDSREEIRTFEQEHVTTGGAVGKRHLGSNIVIKEGKDEVVNTAFVTNDLIVVEARDIPYVVATARYNNSKVIKTDKGWKFSYRNLKVDEGFMKAMAREQQKPQQQR
jgi:hypothetical protein